MNPSGTFFTSRMSQRTPLIYGSLLAVWGVIIAWQLVEHHRVHESARNALVHRSNYIADIISGVISSARFRAVVVQDRLESALNKLIKPGELISAALLNASGEVVAYVGKPIDLEKTDQMREPQRWGQQTVTFVSPVDLGNALSPQGESNHPPIIVQPPRRPPLTNGSPLGRAFARGEPRPGEPPQPEPRPLDSNPPSSRTATRTDPERQAREREARRRSGRPPWMTEAEYQSALEKRGLHGLVLVMSTDSLRAARVHDFWLRCIIGCLASVSVVGLGLAWQNVVKSSELQMRLLRASELNSHLKEMNVAAAGLAHETRNPLNIIRGLAQMVSKESTASDEIRKKSREIADEVDRVTAQLNEFINYSKPREVRRAPVGLGSVVGDVVRALKSDLEDKGLRLILRQVEVTVDADEPLLRQVLFNLLINAVQAVDCSGEIQIVTDKSNSQEAYFEIRDNGPGVPDGQREEIFKPYFTTHQKGTGLGLAVVQQITLAHGWDVECLPNQPRGAVFRVSRLKLTSNS
ncbi:MAG: sensor histidine kinase [Limisphaerales bacterium]